MPSINPPWINPISLWRHVHVTDISALRPCLCNSMAISHFQSFIININIILPCCLHRFTVGLKVNHLPRDIKPEELKGMFDRFGSCSIHFREGCVESYAFINYRSMNDASAAMREMNGAIVGGRRISVILQNKSRLSQPYTTERQPRRYQPHTARPSPVSRSVLERLGPPVPSSPTPMVDQPVSNMETSNRETQPTLKLKTDLSCDPVVARVLMSVYREEVESLANPNGVVVERLGNDTGLALTGSDPGMLAVVKSRIATLIREKIEHKVLGENLSLHCMYIPLLIRQEVVIQIERKHGVEILINSNEERRVTLSSFAQQVRGTQLQSSTLITATDLKVADVSSYVSNTTEQTVTWLFEDDAHQFSSFAPADAEKVEKMFQTRSPTHLKFNGFEYTFSFTPGAMRQTNISTQRIRRIQRIASPVHHHVALHIRGLRNHHKPASDELMQVLDTSVSHCELEVPPSTKSCREVLLQSASQYLVKTEVTDSKIKVTGIKGYVHGVHASLLKQMLEQPVELVLAPPDHWEPQEGKVELKPVTRGTSEWNEVDCLLRKTIPNARVLEIIRIQNTWIWEMYSFSKQRMSKKNSGVVNEKKLFHGTSGTPPDKIYNSEKGFDPRLASRGMWGEGTYFAVNADYSASGYAYSCSTGKQIFLALVLTGETYRCPPSRGNLITRNPPAKTSGDGDYDSVSGNTNGSDVYVIYDHEKAYPAYLITLQ